METTKKKSTSRLTDIMDANESRGTSITETSTKKDGQLEQQTDNPKTLVAIQPKIHSDEPLAKRPKVISTDASQSQVDPAIPTTAATTSEANENVEGTDVREDQPIRTVGISNETSISTEHLSHSGTPAGPAKSKSTAEHIVVGSERWKELKRVSHMEVERRRRETINDHINQLARMIPTENRQKGAILRATVAHIKSLKEQHDADTQKWALEKLLAEQTIKQLQEELEKYKFRYQTLKRAADTEHNNFSEDSDSGEQQKAANSPPPQ